MTRGEIAEKLAAIVRQEKDVPDDLLRPETALAVAGIDSLDSLTILFAIEEQFRISSPDYRARAIKTFGDMIDVVQERVPASLRASSSPASASSPPSAAASPPRWRRFAAGGAEFGTSAASTRRR